MLRVNGLYGHIRRNNAKSLALLGAFVLLFQLVAFALQLPTLVRNETYLAREDGLALGSLALLGRASAEFFTGYWQVPLTGCLCWLVMAWLFYKPVLARATAARAVTRSEEPRLYNLVENLAIAAGLPMPAVHVMETPALNAYAAGLIPRTAVVAVTRGLLRALNERELEAVLAHELTHVKNRDIRLLAVATLFSAIVFRTASLILVRNFKPSPRLVLMAAMLPFYFWEVLAVVAWACVALGAMSVLLRLAVSRTREYLADAGSVELTKDPDALIGALRKIHGRETIEGLDAAVQQMMIAAPGLGFLSTHPLLESRIAALRRALPGAVTAAEVPAPMPVWVSPAAAAPAAVPANSFRTSFGHLAPAGALDAGLSAPRLPAPSLLIPSLGEIRQMLAPLAALKPPDWVSHPYVLGPAVVMNLVLWVGGLYLFDRPTFTRLFTLTPPVHVAPGTAVCFSLDDAQPYAPGTRPFAPPVSRSSERPRHEVVLAASERCPLEGCEKKAQQDYDWAVWSYMLQRMRHTRSLDREHGAPGLAFAQSSYDSAGDRAVIADFRRRVASGRSNPNRNRDTAAAFDLALNRPASAFVPCRTKQDEAANRPADAASARRR
ncbi:MAG TPA: M48 family metalloprotease [Beijerinckiaceae bacterium]|nr:M48 family metalloprotease [Beijerinckiaceae bacterium]